MIIKNLAVGPIQANCFIVADDNTKKAVIIDAGGDASRILKTVEDMKVEVVAVVATHGHFDHVEAMGEVKKALGVQAYCHPQAVPLIKNVSSQASMFGMSAASVPQPENMLEDGDEVAFGDLKLRTVHTPGHSPGSVSYMINGNVFVGDLIFLGSIGRTDLMGGDYDTLINSVKDKIFTLPDETKIHPGHGPSTTVGDEKRTNPFFR